MPEDEPEVELEAAEARAKVTDEAVVQREIVLTEAERQREELRKLAREEAHRVVDDAVLAATTLDETQGGLTNKIQELVEAYSVKRRHVVILYVVCVVLVLVTTIGGTAVWFNVEEVKEVRCKALNEAGRRELALWEATFADIGPSDTPEGQARVERFRERLFMTFPQEDCG